MSLSAVSSELTQVMSTMRLSEELVEFITARRDTWTIFGKKNSHLYRQQLMTMMTNSGLSPEAKVMVYFFFAVIKNQARIVKALDAMPQDVKLMRWFSQTRDFIAVRVYQYVSSAERQGKFPGVNIPGTNPGLDILLWCLMTRNEDRTLDILKDRTTFCQIALNDEMQTLAKEGYRKFWDVTVKGTQNPDAITMNLPSPQMREEYYRNPASDRYPLLDRQLRPVEQLSRESGYNRVEVERYLRAFDVGQVGSAGSAPTT